MDEAAQLLAVTNLRRGLALLLTAALLWGISYVLSDSDLPGGALSYWLVIGLGGLGCGVTGVLRVIYGLWRWNAPAKADG